MAKRNLYLSRTAIAVYVEGTGKSNLKLSFLPAFRRGLTWPRSAACLGPRGCLLYSILIVDDNVIVRRTLRSFLERSDRWSVCGEAADGHEAVEKARELGPDLVILDLSMPRMNGLEAARELKLTCPAVLLVMFTTFKTPELEDQAIGAGCAAVISKSDVHHLFSSIQTLLSA